MKEELFEVTEQRRQDMRTLFDLFEGKGDKEQWCIVKHAAMAMYTAFEAWQASDNDRLLYQICIEKMLISSKNHSIYRSTHYRMCFLL